MNLEAFLSEQKAKLYQSGLCGQNTGICTLKAKKTSAENLLYLSLKIIPGANKTEFAELMIADEPVLKIRVAAAPEKGKANREIIKFLESYFHGKAEIISGHTGARKLVKIF